MLGNIRRDYKQYRLQKGEAKGRFGCAVMVFGPKVMFERFGKQECLDVIGKYMDENDLQLFGIMCNIMNMVSGEMDRQIFLYSRLDGDFANTFEDLTTYMKQSELLDIRDNEVKTKMDCGEYAYYKLSNASVSRKKFEKVFREFYQ